MLFPNVDLLASDKCEEDLPETRDPDTRRQHRDADLSDVSVNGGVHLSRTRLARLARLLPKLRLCGIECLDTRISRIPLRIQLPLMLHES